MKVNIFRFAIFEKTSEAAFTATVDISRSRTPAIPIMWPMQGGI